MAAKEELETADETKALIYDTQARLEDEMQRLAHLSEYVSRKDAEATEKLQQAEELSQRLHAMDASVKQDLEEAERQRREISEDRMSLARERVSVLKESSVGKEGFAISQHSRGLGSVQPSLRRVLDSLKDDLNNLERL